MSGTDGSRLAAAVVTAGLALLVIAAGWPAATLADGPELWPTVVKHGWLTKTLDLPGPVAGGVALSLDSQGRPHLAYLLDNGTGSSTAYHAVLAGTGWISEAIGAPATGTISLRVAADGAPRVAYTRPPAEVTYGVLTSTGWITAEVNGSPGSARPTIAIHSDGRPVIAYLDVRPPEAPSPRGAVFASWDGKAWKTEIMDDDVVDCGFDCDTPSLGMQTPANIPHVALRRGGTGKLIYLTRPGATWITQTVEVTGARQPVLDVTSAGDVSIAYEYQDASIRYAWNEAGAWSTETAEAGFAAPVSLAVDRFDRPHLAYCDPRELPPAGLGGGLRHAWRSAVGWVSEQVAAVSCRNASLALDADDSPIVAYYDSASGVLGYVRWAPQEAAVVLPSAGGLLMAASNEALLTFGAGAFTDTATVTYTVVHSSTVPPLKPRPAAGQVGDAFVLEASYADGGPATPGEPFTLTLYYGNSGRGTVTEDSLSFYWYNGNAWVAEPSTVNPLLTTVTATPTHFSLWAVFGESIRTFLPIVLQPN